jgi:hypothetical protein
MSPHSVRPTGASLLGSELFTPIAAHVRASRCQSTKSLGCETPPSPLDAAGAHRLLAFGSSGSVVAAAHGGALRVTDAVAYAKESLLHAG